MKYIIFEVIALIVTSVVTSIIFWLVTPDNMIAAKNIIPILIIILIILYGTIKYIFQLRDELNNVKQIKLPRLKTIDDDYYIFEPSDVFEPQSYCMLYYIDKTKKKLAFGIVETIIDTSHLLQVKILEKIDTDTQKKMLINKNKIYLKPTITTTYISKENIMQGDV